MLGSVLVSWGHWLTSGVLCTNFALLAVASEVGEVGAGDAPRTTIGTMNAMVVRSRRWEPHDQTSISSAAGSTEGAVVSTRECTIIAVTAMATATHDTAMMKASRKPPARALTADSP
jgi:hypothetical protein